jgi:hypothetical protein
VGGKGDVVAATQNAARPAAEGIMGVYVAWGFAYLDGAQNRNGTWTIKLPSSGSSFVCHGVTSVTFQLHVEGSGGPGLGEADVAFAVFTL